MSGGHRQGLPGFRKDQQVSRGVDRYRGESAVVGMCWGESAGVGMCRGKSAGVGDHQQALAGGGHGGLVPQTLPAGLFFYFFLVM